MKQLLVPQSKWVVIVLTICNRFSMIHYPYKWLIRLFVQHEVLIQTVDETMELLEHETGSEGGNAADYGNLGEHTIGKGLVRK
jgi:hypothetical protein